jgi:RNase P/RNase MRP subunit p29
MKRKWKGRYVTIKTLGKSIEGKIVKTTPNSFLLLTKNGDIAIVNRKFITEIRTKVGKCQGINL